jgi:hypothetical protein
MFGAFKRRGRTFHGEGFGFLPSIFSERIDSLDVSFPIFVLGVL